MAVRTETITKCTYYATIGCVEVYEEDNSVKVNVGNYRTKDPQQLREFASMLNDVAALLEADDV